MLSGFAWHSEKTNAAGREYDVVIEGIGYQYRKNGNSVSVILLNDSNSELMPIMTVGASYEVVKNISIGIEGGVTSKKVYNGYRIERCIFPIIFPKIEATNSRYMISVAYLPNVSNDHISMPHLVYVNFGIKF